MSALNNTGDRSWPGKGRRAPCSNGLRRSRPRSNRTDRGWTEQAFGLLQARVRLRWQKAVCRIHRGVGCAGQRVEVGIVPESHVQLVTE